MADHDELYSDSDSDHEDDGQSIGYSRDDISELGPEDSASQIGRAITTNEEVYSSPRSPLSATEGWSHSLPNGSYVRPFATRPDAGPPSTPPSRRNSMRSSRGSRILTPTTFVPSNKDRVRYSWQSIHGDEPDRPRIHVIKIVSNTATASAGMPGGEALGFAISAGGRRIVAYNSARLFILQTAALPVNISQEYALRRRPIAVEVVDEGNILAVLADEHTVNIYDLSHRRVRRIKTIKPDFPTSTIALSSTGGLLAAAYEGGVEIFSLDASALSTDRRAVRSSKMDRLAFSEDGSTLLGTTLRIHAAATMIVSVPVFPMADNGIPTHEELKEAWCSGLLNPENILNSSHATFMRESGSTCNEKLFSWNGIEDTFGILGTTDMQYSNIDFPLTISPPLSSVGGLGAAIHSVPALHEYGDTVGMIVNDRTVRLYVVPRNTEDYRFKIEAHSIDHELDEEFGCPFTDVRWVHQHSNLPASIATQLRLKGRLVVVSPGGVVPPDMPEDSVEDIEGGRIILFDFDSQFAGQPGQTFTLNLGKAPPQMLEEEEIDVAQEVDLVRRRTVNQSRSGTLSTKTSALGRAATTLQTSSRQSPRTLWSPIQRSTSPTGLIQQTPAANYPPGAFSHRNRNHSVLSTNLEAARSLPDLLEANEMIEVDEPYVQGAPRSQATMQRAASAANRHRIQTFEERAEEREAVDGLGFLPLPEYTEEPNAPLPGRYRALAGLDIPKTFDTSRYVNGHVSSPKDHVQSPDRSIHASPGSPTSASSSVPTGSPIPRALQRAYSNAISPLGSGPAPALIGEWENVSPVMARAPTDPLNRSNSSRDFQPSVSSHHSPSSVAAISPVRSSPLPEERPTMNSRMSHSLFAPIPLEDRPASLPPRVRAAASSPRLGRHRPPHVMAFQSVNAAAANLIPDSPNARRHSLQPLGSVPHPVTNWYPPAPSASSGTHAGVSPERPSTSQTDRFGEKSGKGRMRIGRSKSRRTMAEDEKWMSNDVKKCVMM